MPPVHHDLPALQPDAAFGVRQVFGHRQKVDAAPRDQTRQTLRQRGLRRQDRSGDLAQQLDIAQRGAVLPAGQVEIVDHQRFLIDRRVAAERVQRQHRRGVVVHEIAPDLVRAVGQPGPQQQHRRLHRAGGQHHQRGRKHLAPAVDLGPGDPARAVRDQPRDRAAGAQGDIRMRQGLRDPHRFGIQLAGPGIGIGVPGRLSALQPLIQIHAQRQRGRMQAHPGQAPAQIGDGRFIGHRAEGIAPRMRRFCRVFAQLAAHLIHLFGALVEGLQRLIGQRPAGGCPLQMAQGSEIFAAVAQQHGPVEFRIAADIVVIAGVEGPTLSVQPGFRRAEMATLENGAVIAVCGRGAQMIAPLQDQDAPSGGGKGCRQRRPAHARADDQDVGRGHVAPRQAVRRNRQGAGKGIGTVLNGTALGPGARAAGCGTVADDPRCAWPRQGGAWPRASCPGPDSHAGGRP